jgi:hypothetical protein
MVQLLDERDLGVLTAVMSLLVALVASNPDGYTNCLSKCVYILERLTKSQDILQEYTYYGIPSPWLQVKSLVLVKEPLVHLSEIKSCWEITIYTAFRVCDVAVAQRFACGSFSAHTTVCTGTSAPYSSHEL